MLYRRLFVCLSVHLLNSIVCFFSSSSGSAGVPLFNERRAKGPVELQDLIFNNDINRAIILTEEHYENMIFREALRTCFYDLQVC